MRDGKSAAAFVDLFVDPRGRVEGCNTLSVVGDEKLGQAICGIAIGKKLEPAKDGSGKPSYGVFRTLLTFTTPDTEMGDAIDSNVRTPTLDFQVKGVPEGIADPYKMTVELLVTQGGVIAQCEGSPESDPKFAKGCLRSVFGHGSWNAEDAQG